MLQIENMEHCDFVPLRNMLIRTYLQDLKEVTNNVLYENFRCRKLAGVAGTTMDKIPNKVTLDWYSTTLVDRLQFDRFTLYRGLFDPSKVRNDPKLQTVLRELIERLLFYSKDEQLEVWW